MLESIVSEVSPVIEEYLENIYRLQKKRGVARTSDLVKQLRVVPGTITNTIERLEREGLVIHEPYKGVKLTDKGNKIALDVLRRHRLSERLLMDILNVKWSETHDAACKLEHAINDNITKKIETRLGYPKTCPHGNPIPTKEGKIIEENSKPLTELKNLEEGVVVKITEEKAELLYYLERLGLIPGARIKVIEKTPFKGPITIKIGESNYPLNFTTASIIQVKNLTQKRDK
jgi:DtxR family Mn-dependent transcriptional regulator